ncbi:MAG: hypothetical protein NC548_37220 [Lachnospiraceae bacterium]|nr:hypothetical protein [Lachnospiraceae bacterium]
MSRVLYGDLSPEEIKNNIVDTIIDRLLILAYHNSDFICSDCVDEIKFLKNLLSYFIEEDSEYNSIINEINGIMED